MTNEITPGQVPDPDEVADARLHARATAWVRAWIRNSPWMAIAVLIHVLIIAVMSVYYTHREGNKAEQVATSVSISPSPMVLPDPIETPPELIDRDSVPIFDENEKEGIVNPDENYTPEADPGKVGEITEETDPNKEAGIYNPDPEALSNLPSGATGGTAIGVGTVGHYGTGTPSAWVSRRAGGGGKGGGGLGQGGGGGRGGKRAEEAVLSALIWLKKHQSPDGRWDCDGFTEMCKKNTCTGLGSGVHDVGVTGLALLCFLGAGYTHDSPGQFKETVKNGLKYLMSVQDEDGCFGERVGNAFMYDHACAALAMTEAYGMTEAKPFRDPAQKGIAFILKAQNPYSAWRYSYPPDGDNDTSVTGWMVMVLKSGKLAKGLNIDEVAINSAMGWVEEMTDPMTGRTGYTDKGGASARMTELSTTFPADKSEAMTAVGVLTRIFAGKTPETDPMIAKGADLMAAKPPEWNADTGSIDFYYWYYATLAMFQVGGTKWDAWNRSIQTAILAHQRVNQGEDEYGSWDAVDPWSPAGGRIYATALNCLCMEVYYRYPRVFGAGAKTK